MQNHRITADIHTLMRQAPMTANTYLDAAIEALEERWGKGSAQEHPAIVAAHMNAAALDFGAAIIARAIEAAADREQPYPMA